MKPARLPLLIGIALACGHAALPAAGGAERANELLRSACARALASLAPDAAGARRVSLELPAELAPALRALHGTGMGNRVDALEAALERAARLALQASQPWLEGAVARFAPADPELLLSGPDDALAGAFRSAHEADLRAQLAASSERVLAEAGAFAALENVRAGAERLPLRRSIEPDLVSLVTEQALLDFFDALAEQEKSLRRERETASDGYGGSPNSGPLMGSEAQGGSR